jgi:NTP pyrophosphatase (non-canonical NTP hydrolase)
MLDLTAESVTKLSKWIDEHDVNVRKDATAQLYERTVVKLMEEVGETAQALIGMTGQNSRKGFYATRQDVINELLDVALTAMCGVEHLIGNTGHATAMLENHIANVSIRAGIL